jgi:hypothetical protein
MDATEITIAGRDSDKITLAAGFASHGEPVLRVRNKSGWVQEVRLGGGRLRQEKRGGARYVAAIRVG